MKLLMIHAWNEDELSYRGKFSGMLSYPSMTLAVLYSLVPKRQDALRSGDDIA